ncbi:MAG: glycine betaine ABC transporter substrate-binding protein [Bacillota bacterium]
MGFDGKYHREEADVMLKRAAIASQVLVAVAVMIVLAVGCVTKKAEQPQAGPAPAPAEKKIAIGAEQWTEGLICSELMAQLAEKHGFKVERKFHLQGKELLHAGITSGQFDAYPEYTSSGWLFVLKQEPIHDPDVVFEKVKAAYEEKFGITWLPTLGFNDTYALAVTKDFAAKHNVRTCSELAKIKGLRFGAEPDFFERKDGYDGLVETYGFDCKKVQLEIGLKYKALAEGKVDVIDAFTTDGLLRVYDLVILEDDKRFFVPYYCCPIVRMDTLKKYPELRDIWGALAGKINEETMVALNYEVDVNKRDPAEVAAEFLRKLGLR